MLQPARDDGISSYGGGFQACRRRPPETGGFHHTPPVHAVAVVARGTDFRLLTFRQGPRKAPRNGGAEVYGDMKKGPTG